MHRSLEARVRRDLNDVVVAVRPTGSWEDVVARLDAPARTRSEEDVIVLDTPLTEVTPPSSNRRLVMGATAVTLLLAAIAAALLIVGDGEDVETIDDPPVTTTSATPPEAPGADEAPIEVADQLVEAFTSGERERFMSLFAADAMINDSAFFDNGRLGGLDDPSVRAAFEGSVDAAMVGQMREPPLESTCSEELGRVVCETRYNNSISEQVDLQRIFLTIEDGLITSFRRNVDEADPAARLVFFDWLADLELTEDGDACVDIDFASTACGEMWFDLVDRYRAERDTG